MVCGSADYLAVAAMGLLKSFLEKFAAPLPVKDFTSIANCPAASNK